MLNDIKANFFEVLASIKNILVSLPKLHLYLICVLFFLCLMLLFLPFGSGLGKNEIALPKLVDSEYIPPNTIASYDVDEDVPDYEWVVNEGDTLGEIFSLFRISSTMTDILEADKNVLSLDVINKGDIYRFWLDRNDDNFTGKGLVLTRLEQVLGPEHQVVFKRNGDGFEYKETVLEGVWKKKSIKGEIKSGGTFSGAANVAGLSANDITVVEKLLKTKINFAREIRSGDKFQIALSYQYIDDELTGNTKVEGVRFFNRKRVHSAFSYKDNYYDDKGDGLERAFARYPLKGNFRISSAFNPRRRHPITKLIRPHNGTDFAVRTGTPIYAPGDGTVKRVVRHKYAGLYIELQHSYKYRTRYLHLSKSLVRKGMKVKRGQKIALSGNTGASTGAHLHYEFHVNQKPIDAMGNNVPVAIGVDKKSMPDFKRHVADLIKLMENKS